MDEATLRPIVDAHAAAVVDPIDAEHVQGDLIEELHPHIPEVAQLLPQPVTSAEVQSVEVHDDHADVHITYSGADASVTLHSRWEDRGAGQPQIVRVVPAD